MKKIRILKKELWNLDATLADIIHQYLVAFKESDRHLILYSHEYTKPDFNWEEEYSDDTEWFLDELIWTFKVLSNSGETPEIEELIHEVFGAERTMVIDENGEVTFNLDEEKYAKLREIENVTQARIKAGLELFAKYFQGLWD